MWVNATCTSGRVSLHALQTETLNKFHLLYTIPLPPIYVCHCVDIYIMVYEIRENICLTKECEYLFKKIKPDMWITYLHILLAQRCITSQRQTHAAVIYDGAPVARSRGSDATEQDLIKLIN